MRKSFLAGCLASFSSLLSVGSASALTLSLSSGVLPVGGATDQGTFAPYPIVKTVTFDADDVTNGYGNNTVNINQSGFDTITKNLGSTGTVTFRSATGAGFLGGSIFKGVNDINATAGFAPPGPADTKITQPNYPEPDYTLINQRNSSNFIGLIPPSGGGNSTQIEIVLSNTALKFFGVSLGFFDSGNSIIINLDNSGTLSTVTYGNGGFSFSDGGNTIVTEGSAYLSFIAGTGETITGLTIKQTNPGSGQGLEIDNLGFSEVAVPFDFEPSLSFLTLGGIYGWYKFKNRKQGNK